MSSPPPLPGQKRVSAAFAAALAEGRDRFNAAFAEARRLRPDLDARAFSALLTGPGDTVVRAVAAVNAERVPDTATAVYEAALTLTGERLTGPGGRYPVLAEMWERLLPAVAPLVADQPVKVIAALTNALFQVASTPGARPADWLDAMTAAGPALPSVSDLLRAGQLAAWRAGLAHYRAGALAAGDALPPAVAAGFFGVPKAEWSEMRKRLALELWWDPAAPAVAGGRRIAGRAGAFRGLGGLFVVPPLVTVVGGTLVVSSGGECWQLTADVFGATFHRLDPASLAASERMTAIWQGDRFSVDGTWQEIPGIGKITSVAVCQGTAAVTGSLTHSLTLVALA